jgi:hypothetical protein
MKKDYQAKEPLQFLKEGGKTYIPVPIRNIPNELRDAIQDQVSSIAGEGKLYADRGEGEKYNGSYLLLLTHSERLPGDWIVDYDLHWADGTYIRSISAAAQIS